MLTNQNGIIPLFMLQDKTFSISHCLLLVLAELSAGSHLDSLVI